ncbi:MAG: glycoside hydrolase family 44 protein [Specibacter sp.]
MIAAGAAGAVVATAAVSLVVAGMPLLQEMTRPAAQETTQPPVVISTLATPEKFPAFNRADYVQAPVAATATEPVKASIKVGADKTGRVMPEGLAGLSLDTDHMVDMQMNPDQSNLAEILKMSGDPVIRFGGQAADRRFFWTSTDEPIPDWKVVPAYPGDVRKIVKVTPAVLENVNRLLVAGNARILLTANLGHLDAARTADFAKWAHKIFGNRLVGMSLGNEPNGWGASDYTYRTLRDQPWSFDKYIEETLPVAQAVKDAVPEVKIAGPDVYTEAWWKQYVAAGVPNLEALSYHNYPVSKCDADPATDPQARSIANMLSRDRSDASLKYAEAAVKLADSAKLAAWNTETNASSCPGSSAVTKNHASGLWAANYAMLSASAGVTMLNFHGGLEACKGGAPMSPLCDTGTVGNPTGQMTMRPEYYGIMMVNKLGSGDFLRSEVTGSENIYAYPVKRADGTMGLMVVNQNDPAKQARAKITLTLPAQAATGTMSQMSGPTLDGEGETRIDGQESSGVAQAKQARIPGFKAGAQTITVELNSGTVSILNFTF